MFFCRDMLHIGDNRGVAAMAMASCFEGMLVDHELGGSTIDENLEILNKRIDEFYEKSRVANRLPKLSRSSIKTGGDFPILSGPGIKAANPRALIPFAAKL